MNYPFADSTLVHCDTTHWTCDWDYPISEIIAGISVITTLLQRSSILSVTESLQAVITVSDSDQSPLLQ